MKRISIIALLMMVLVLAGCSGGDSEFKTDVSTTNLAEQVDAVIDSEALIPMEDSYLQNAMQLDPTMFAEYVVKINSKGINIDEYGIFKAPDADSAKDVKEAIDGYIQLRLDNWMPEYMPEELPKLEGAKVKLCGQYVMYVILPESGAQSALDEFESGLKK